MLYVLNVVDVARHKVAGEVMRSKSSQAIVEALKAIWGRLGVPVRAQFDNQQALAGSGRHLGQVVRFCLMQGVIPVFVPYSEPWRQGVVEHYNDTFDKRFFRTERFADVPILAARMADFAKCSTTRSTATRPSRVPLPTRPRLAPVSSLAPSRELGRSGR